LILAIFRNSIDIKPIPIPVPVPLLSRKEIENKTRIEKNKINNNRN
jgi:hypothetical protein